MILDVLTYLKADTALDALLGASGSNSKIYPNQAPQQTALPYITYDIDGDGTFEENLSEVTVSFDCVSDEYLVVRALRDRLVTLLDKQDKIRDFVTSTGYYFYWCKNRNGEDLKEPKQDYFHKQLVFDFKYAKK
jgi:hypothetical protein